MAGVRVLLRQVCQVCVNRMTTPPHCVLDASGVVWFHHHVVALRASGTCEPRVLDASAVVRDCVDMSEHEPPVRWTASTIHPDMWVDTDQDPRESDVELTDERSTLLEYLRVYRMTFEMKCAGLSAEQLARRSVPPSTLSLLGLIRHLADAERGWFRRVMSGDAVPWIFRTDDDRDAAFNAAIGSDEAVAEAWNAWRQEVAYAEAFVAGASDLGVTGRTSDGSDVQLREVLVHMIEEYARHSGHADLLRECIDGRTGQ